MEQRTQETAPSDESILVKMRDGTEQRTPLCSRDGNPLPEDRTYWPVVMMRTLQVPDCGCHVDGSGIIPDPVRIHFCDQHAGLQVSKAEASVVLDALDSEVYVRVPHTHSPDCVGRKCPAEDFAPRASTGSAADARSRVALKRRLRRFLSEGV